jgi:hypothetical protein
MNKEIYALLDRLDEELRPGAAGEYLDIYLLGRAESLDKTFTFQSPKAEDAEDDPDTPDWAKALGDLKRVEAYLDGSISAI